MPEFLPPWPLLGAFVLASLALAVTPGPAVVYIVTRTLAQGRRAGLASVARWPWATSATPRARRSG